MNVFFCFVLGLFFFGGEVGTRVVLRKKLESKLLTFPEEEGSLDPEEDTPP